jgi:hypothetical protein
LALSGYTDTDHVGIYYTQIYYDYYNIAYNIAHYIAGCDFVASKQLPWQRRKAIDGYSSTASSTFRMQ